MIIYKHKVTQVDIERKRIYWSFDQIVSQKQREREKKHDTGLEYIETTEEVVYLNLTV